MLKYCCMGVNGARRRLRLLLDLNCTCWFQPSFQLQRYLCTSSSFGKDTEQGSNCKKRGLQNLLLQMPREPKHVPALRKSRQQVKDRGMKYAPGTITLQVLGSGAPGAPRALYVFTDQNRYLFNCGEGSQRLAHEHKMKLAKLEHVFVTHKSWENIGGLPGLALTVQDIGVPQLTLHGPQGLEELFQVTRRFVVLKDLRIESIPWSKGHFEDSVMHVEYVALWGAKRDSFGHCNEVLEEDTTDYYAHERTGRRARFFQEDQARSRGATEHYQNREEEQEMSVAYVCRPHKKPGALVLEKCVEKGVPAGPLLGRLKAGEDVTLPNGNVVKAMDVRMPDDPGPIFIVVECPSEAFLESLTGSIQLARHQSGVQEEETAYAVVHFTPPHVMHLEAYRKWMENFSPSTIHMVLNEENQGLGSMAVHRIQHKLNLLSSEIFPLLQEPETLKEDGNESKGIYKNDMGLLLARGHTLMACHLRPRKGLDHSALIKINPQEYLEETMAVEGFPAALKELKEKLVSIPQKEEEKEYPRLLFLGTGSCIPNKTRNTSGLLLNNGPDKYMLLDCGEGTFGQLIRFFGHTKGEEVLSRLGAVYVSHLHADHHIGLLGLLKARHKALNALCPSSPPPPLLLIAPEQIMAWLSRYHRHFEPVLNNLCLLPSAMLIGGDSLQDGMPEHQRQHRILLDSLGLSHVETTPVEHCPNAFGVRLTHRDGWSLVYSGDTMPCRQLVQLGQGCDLLVHEATMEDGLEEEAKLKTHSTTSQAIEQGRLMGAKYTILTHFSQRYAKLPLFNHNFGQAVGIAFDNMMVQLGNLKCIPLMYPALKVMFAEHYEEMEQKTAKKMLKAEKERERKASV